MWWVAHSLMTLSGWEGGEKEMLEEEKESRLMRTT